MANATATKPAKKDKGAKDAPAPEKKVRLKKDGTPWGVPEKKRTNAEILEDYKVRLANLRESFRKTEAKYERMIAKFSVSATSKEDAAKEVLAEGMTLDQIVAAEAKLRKAKEALKAMTPEQIEALKAQAEAEKAQAVPAFFGTAAPVGTAPASDDEDEDEDEE